MPFSAATALGWISSAKPVLSGNILVTGGSGTFGTAFAKRLLLSYPYVTKIALLSRGEYRQFQVLQELKPFDIQDRIRPLIGDVRDKERLVWAMEDIDIVVHAAALKRIEVGQYNPLEVTRTNIDGSVNVIEAAHRAGVKKVVALSSDKAFQPVSPYGLSKAMAECLFMAANNTRGRHGPKYSVCRYGNIFGSTGSVVPVWRKMIADGATALPVTNPDCTRFFMRIEEAVELVLKTIADMPTELAIPKLPAYRMGDLAEAMGMQTTITGLPAWEKIHEGMSPGNTSDVARRMTIDELKEELARDKARS